MQMPKKILFLIDSLGGGGAERIMSYLLNRLDRNRYAPSLGLLLRPDVGYPLRSDLPMYSLCSDELSGLGKALHFFLSVLVVPLTLFKGRDFRRNNNYFCAVLRQFVGGFIALRRHLLMDRPEIIVVFLQTSIVITIVTLWLMRSKIPVICSDRILLTRELKSRRFPRLNCLLMRWLYRNIHGYVAVSDEAGRDMVANFGLSPNNVRTIYNGLDLGDLNKRSRETLQDDDGVFHEGTVHFISMGRLTEQKGFDLLIKAFSHTRKKIDCRLVIIGDGELSTALKQLARDRMVEADVVFAGWKTNPFPYLAAADVFVMSSRYEGFPNALMEAMAAGLPVVSTDCPSGPAELLSGGRYGFLVPNESKKELADAMFKMVSDAKLREDFGRRAKKRMADFTLDRMIDEFEALLSCNER